MVSIVGSSLHEELGEHGNIISVRKSGDIGVLGTRRESGTTLSNGIDILTNILTSVSILGISGVYITFLVDDGLLTRNTIDLSSTVGINILENITSQILSTGLVSPDI